MIDSTKADVLTVLNKQTKAWTDGFLGYLMKQASIHENPFSFQRNRFKHDEWLLGRRTARSWVGDKV